MEIKLFDSELRVMEVIWKAGEISAKEIARKLSDEIGWNKNTTYTVIKKCIQKSAIERMEPDFICRALVKKENIQEKEATDLINKIFDGSADMLFASLVNKNKLSKKEIENLKKLVDGLSEE